MLGLNIFLPSRFFLSLRCCHLLLLLTLFLWAPVSGGRILPWCPVQCVLCIIGQINWLIDWLLYMKSDRTSYVSVSYLLSVSTRTRLVFYWLNNWLIRYIYDCDCFRIQVVAAITSHWKRSSTAHNRQSPLIVQADHLCSTLMVCPIVSISAEERYRIMIDR